MSIVTQISLISLPGAASESAPLHRRIQLAPSADGRAAVTLVCWLSPLDSADASS